MTASFADHRAFRPDRARALQVSDLNDIRAVLPLEAAEACRLVWMAMQRADHVPAALAALQALPESVRSDVIARADQIGQQPARRAA